MRENDTYSIKRSTEEMANRICSILYNCSPSVYIYGSVALNDFRSGWSDIDILVLTQKQISEDQAQELVSLRQSMTEEDPDNPYYGIYEGGMLSLSAFIQHRKDRVVYWGSSGEYVTDTFHFDSFCMMQLIDNGILYAGEDIRRSLEYPTYKDLRTDVQQVLNTVRWYASKTGRSLHSFGWLLDISRCIYTLRTGKIAAKTFAGEWAFRNNLCPSPKCLQTAIMLRHTPALLKKDQKLLDYAATLGDEIQAYADVLEKEFDSTRKDT